MPNNILALLILLVVLAAFAVQSIPMGVTAILGAVAMAAFGLMDFSDVFRGFSSDTVMMVAGMIVVGNAVNETKLSVVLGKLILRIKLIQRNERLFLLVLLIFITAIGSFVTNTAVVAIFLPLVASVARASGGAITKKNTYMAIGITAVVSGNMTLVSSTPQMAAQAVLSQTAGCVPLGFFTMTKAAIPLSLLAIFYFTTFGYSLSKKVFTFPEVGETRDAADDLPANKAKMIVCGVVFCACIVFLVGGFLPFGVVSIVAACLMILSGCISFPRAMLTMDWNSVLVIAGALSFGVGLERSGAVNLVADVVLKFVGGDRAGPFPVFAVIVVLSSVLSTTMSNTVTAVILTPMAIALAQSLGADPVTFVIGVIFGCNYDFLTPVGTPPVTMTLCGGYRFFDYTKVGGVFNILIIISTILIVPVIYGF